MTEKKMSFPTDFFFAKSSSEKRYRYASAYNICLFEQSELTSDNLMACFTGNIKLITSELMNKGP